MKRPKSSRSKSSLYPGLVVHAAATSSNNPVTSPDSPSLMDGRQQSSAQLKLKSIANQTPDSGQIAQREPGGEKEKEKKMTSGQRGEAQEQHAEMRALHGALEMLSKPNAALRASQALPHHATDLGQAEQRDRARATGRGGASEDKSRTFPALLDQGKSMDKALRLLHGQPKAQTSQPQPEAKASAATKKEESKPVLAPSNPAKSPVPPVSEEFFKMTGVPVTDEGKKRAAEYAAHLKAQG